MFQSLRLTNPTIWHITFTRLTRKISTRGEISNRWNWS